MRFASNCRTRLDQFALGLEVLPDGVLLQDVHPPLAVVPAFRDVSSAFKEQERMKNEAWAYHRDKVIKAGGIEAWQRLSRPGATLTEELGKSFARDCKARPPAELHAAEAFAATQQEVAHGNAESFLATEAAHAAAPQMTDWRLGRRHGWRVAGRQEKADSRPSGREAGGICSSACRQAACCRASAQPQSPRPCGLKPKIEVTPQRTHAPIMHFHSDATHDHRSRP